MAVAFDATTTQKVTGATTNTYSHTTSGSDRVLYVSTNLDEASTSDLITGATYAGVSMQMLTKVQDGLGFYEYLFYLAAPASGANNVVVTASSSTNIVATANSYTGADQSTATPNHTTGAVASTSVNMTLTTIYSNSWVTAGASRHRGWTAGANTTLRTAEGLYNMSSLDSGGLAGGSGTPGSKTLAVTQVDSQVSAWVIAEIPPAGSIVVATPDSLLMSMGVG